MDHKPGSGYMAKGSISNTHSCFRSKDEGEEGGVRNSGLQNNLNMSTSDDDGGWGVGANLCPAKEQLRSKKSQLEVICNADDKQDETKLYKTSKQMF